MDVRSILLIVILEKFVMYRDNEYIKEIYERANKLYKKQGFVINNDSL